MGYGGVNADDDDGVGAAATLSGAGTCRKIEGLEEERERDGAERQADGDGDGECRCGE